MPKALRLLPLATKTGFTPISSILNNIIVGYLDAKLGSTNSINNSQSLNY